jgi:hypothetical protein
VSGRVAWITGASSGIGEAVARGLAAPREIAEGIRKGKAEIVFPFTYLVGMKLLRLPVRPYAEISGWLARRSNRPEASS